MEGRLATVGGVERPHAAATPRHPRQAAIEGVLARTFRIGEASFAVVGLFLLSSALVPLMLERTGVDIDSFRGNAVLRNMFMAIHAGTFLMIAVRWRSVRVVLRRSPAMVALILLAIASVAWSADAALSGRRALALFGTTAFGVWLTARYDPRVLLRLLATALGIAALLSALFAVALPGYGIDTGVHAGTWRGVFQQKNTLAQTMVLCAVAFLLYRPASALGRWTRIGGVGLAALLILLSTSKTALGVLLTLVVLMALYRTLRWRSTVAVPVASAFIVVSGAVATFLVANREEILTLAGKDASFTGRTPIWLASLDMIAQKPLLGYGYSGFWLGWRHPSIAIYQRIGWETPHAHNGFVDLALQLGLVGLALFLIAIVVMAVRGVATVRLNPSREALWPLVMLTYVLLYNVTETTVLQSNTISWALFAAAMFTPVDRRARPRGPS